MHPTFSIRLLKPAETDAALELLQHLNTNVPCDELERRLGAMQKDHPHYQLHGAFEGALLCGVAGCWIGTRIWCGRYLEIDNLVIDPTMRNSGAGTAMIHHFVKLAQEADCAVVLLDSYTSNHASHRLYHRLGFEIWGFHFIKPLDGTRYDPA